MRIERKNKRAERGRHVLYIIIHVLPLSFRHFTCTCEFEELIVAFEFYGGYLVDVDVTS